MTLTPRQLAFYQEHGYLKLDQLAGAEEVEQARGIYDRLFNNQVGRDNGDSFDLAGTDENGKPARLPQLMNPAHYAPELEAFEFRRVALSIAKQLLGDDAAPGDEHAIFKPAGDGAETPWHQDEAYWDPSLVYDAISIWMPLQAATLENGCMHFIPGSQKLDIVEHQSIGGDVRVHGLETVAPVDTSQEVACPLPPGGCTIHHCRTLHYAGANRSDLPRRAYIMTFRLPPVPRIAPRRFEWLERRQAARQQRAAKA